ncbi:MAG: hypothetical protein EOM03_07140 [Clostridia bacterium]|nr:hypothetical protein [Clostridia bacterium]
MELNLKKIHQLLEDRNLVAAQDVFRKMISRLPKNEALSQAYILKAYELATITKHPFEGLAVKQIEAHSVLIRQLIIENHEEFDRRVSRL